MRISLIDPSLFTLPYDESLAFALMERGHDVCLYGRAPRRGEPQPSHRLSFEPLFYEGARAYDGAWEPVRLAAKAADHVRSSARLLAALAAAKPDVIHYQWAPVPLVDRIFLARLRKIAPLFLTVHDTRPFNDRPSAPFQAWGARALYDSFDGLIVHTRRGIERLQAEGVDPARIVCIPHGPLVGERTPRRATLSSAASAGPPTFLLVGKIKPYKGIDTLIRAVSLLPEATRRRARFRIAGKPYMDVAPLVALTHALGVADVVQFEFGFLSDTELANELAGASAFLFPYREIEASGVLFAALAEGKPIIASNIGCFAELLEDGVHGRLVPPGNPDALARALKPLIEDAPARVQMGEAVRSLSNTIPSWETIAELTTAFYAGARPGASVRPLPSAA